MSASLQRFQIPQCQPVATIRSSVLEREFFDFLRFSGARKPEQNLRMQRILNLLTSKTP